MRPTRIRRASSRASFTASSAPRFEAISRDWLVSSKCSTLNVGPRSVGIARIPTSLPQLVRHPRAAQTSLLNSHETAAGDRGADLMGVAQEPCDGLEVLIRGQG